MNGWIAGSLLDLAVVLLSARLLGSLARRLGQPAVLGELAAGVLLGAGLVPLFTPDDALLVLLSGAGLLLLLFETGLGSDLDRLVANGPAAAAVAVVGVAAPFALGWGLMTTLGKPASECVFVGAALTATSVGITARVLFDLGKLDRPEAKIVLGAAVLDDVLGLAVLAAVTGSARVTDTVLIVGAFAAGLLVARSSARKEVETVAKPFALLLAPVFFVMTGAKVDLRAFAPSSPGHEGLLGLAFLLFVAAVLGKLASGLAVTKKGVRRWSVGIGMVPRGEVGLVFASVGLSSGAIDPALYSALVAMVFATTVVTPPLLKLSLD